MPGDGRRCGGELEAGLPGLLADPGAAKDIDVVEVVEERLEVGLGSV
jgi:hypothetical protein